MKAKEPHEKYFEEIAGTEEAAKPFLDVYAELREKEAAAKKDDILRRLVGLIGKCEFSQDEKERYVIARWTEEI